LLDILQNLWGDSYQVNESNTEDCLAPGSSQPVPESWPASNYTGLAQHLITAWPVQADLDRIYGLPIGLSTHAHMHIYTPSSALCNENRSTREMLQLPLPGSHPVLVARKLLFLGSILQGALSASHIPNNMRAHYHNIMSCAIDKATRLVSTDDALTASVEGLECIMIEAMLHNYTGNLHRAWMTTRRACAVAQALGLHRGIELPSLRFLDRETNAAFDPDQFCFRIVEMDRYLSVTLGLPISSLQTHALTSEGWTRRDPLDRMARQHCKLAERMLCGDQLERKLEDVQEMENSLQKAANEMSPQWWLTPELISGDDAVANPFQEVARVNYQFSHYHLLLRVHLPYVMRSSPEYDHSRLAAASASREMLSRYVAFRRSNPGHFYCRGSDYVAFIALTVLCLVHVHAWSTTKQVARPRTDVSKLLTANRLSDRGLMERTLGVLECMRDDATARKLASIMRHLLAVESSASGGVRYSTVAQDDDGAVEYNGDLLDDQTTLQLNIPYFGTIRLRRKLDANLGKEATQPQDVRFTTNSRQSDPMTPFVHYNDQRPRQAISVNNIGYDAAQGGSAEMLDPINEWCDSGDLTMQNINESLFSSLFNGANQDTIFNIGALDNDLLWNS
jgi:hypothetical protein